MDDLELFINRLKKAGVEVKLSANFPWIYIDAINGKRVTEKFHGNHGFTVAFMPHKPTRKLSFTDIGEIFKLIRQYC